MEPSGLAISHFVRFLLVLFRLGGVFAITPMVGGSAVPWRIRVLLALGLSFAVYPVVTPAAGAVPTDWPHLVAGLIGELVVGLICGFVVNLVFAAARMAGAFLSRHMGTGFARVLNPLFESDLPAFGRFFYMFALVVFVAVNGHHILLRGLIGTFDRVPLMSAGFHREMIPVLAGLMGDMFVLMIKLAAPTFAALFLVTVALGIVARILPQMQVLIVGFPVKVALGLLVTSLALGAAAAILTGSFESLVRQLEAVARFMMPR